MATQHETYLSQLPADWKREKISSFARIVGGGTPARDVQSFWDGSIPWLTPGEVSAGDFKEIATTRERITAAGLAASGANVLPARSLMVTTRATLGARVINSVPMTTNQGFRSLVFRKDDVPEFYFYLMEKLKPEMLRRASGTTFLEISGTEFAAIETPDPGAGQKAAIVRVLDTLDTAIHQTEAIIEKLKQVKQGLLHDLLTRGIDENGELRPPQSEAPHLYKQSPLGWIPREWEVAGLAAKASPKRSALRTGPFGSTLKGEHWRQDGRPVITIGSLRENTFDKSELLYISEAKAESLPDFEVVVGDIVFSRVADVGRSVVISEHQAGWIMSSNFMRIAVNAEVARPAYLQVLLTSDERTRGQIRSDVNSGGRDVANSAVLMGLMFVWPTPDEQDEILHRVSTINLKIENERSFQEKLNKAKLGLMSDLLTGRVRVAPLLASTDTAPIDL